MSLKQSRADDFTDWLKVGFALANAGQQYLDVFHGH